MRASVSVVLFCALAGAAVGGCAGESGFNNNPPPPVAEPPGDDDERGNPPDWENCFRGWRGFYSNLSIDHPHVLPRLNEEPAPTDPTVLDWWENPASEKFDPTLDFGLNWWPVDDGFEGDPSYFAVRWQAWLRAWSNTEMQISLGSADDAWVYVDGAPIAEQPGIQEFQRNTYTVSLQGGQYPIEVLFAHRASETSGFAFRVVSGDVSICYPDFGTGTEAE